MKLSKFVIASVFLFGLNAGTVSADTVNPGGDTLLDIFTITGVETNGDSLSQDISANTDFSHWYGIDVDLSANPVGNQVETISSGNQSAVATNSTNIAIWNATEAGGVWTQGTLVGLEEPATGLNQLFATLGTGKYLLNFYGTLLFEAAGSNPQTAQYQFTIDAVKVVPVPAAVWLFGTAMVGFLGLRRKRQAVSIAA